MIRQFAYYITLCLVYLGCQVEQHKITHANASSATTLDSIDIKDAIDTKVDTTLSESKQLSGSARKKSPENQPTVEKQTIKKQHVKKRIAKKKKPRRIGKIFMKKPLLEIGEMIEGETISHRFEFKNIGNAPLEILEAKVTCGCTTPSIPFLAIDPGEEGYIGVTYSSAGKYGAQKANIFIKTNGVPKKATLTITADVQSSDSTTKDTMRDSN